MPRYFTYYWMNKYCEPEEGEEQEEEYLTHVAGNRFLQRGVKPGDFIYVVTVKKGELYVLARMEVGEICDQYEAAHLLDCEPDQLWNAPDHLVAKPGTATRLYYDLWVPVDATERLRFTNGGKGTPQPLKYKAPGYLDNQTLRSVRELMPESAAELDKVLDSASKIARH
jgi:hypothetical protein